MENLDQWILVVIACIAIIAPCITTYLNNRHQYKIAILNTKHNLVVAYINEYFDSLSNYINSTYSSYSIKYLYKSALQKIYIVSNKNAQEILECIDTILVNPDNWNDVIKLNDLIQPQLFQLSKYLSKCI